MSIDINLFCRALGDGSSSTVVKGRELTWQEMDANFIAIKNAVLAAIDLIPELTGANYGSAIFAKMNHKYSYGNAAMLTLDGQLVMWSSSRGYKPTAANVNSDLPQIPLAIKFPRSPANYGSIIDFGCSGGLSFALFDDGSLYTWGINTYGQLGTGDTVNRTSPTLIADDVAEVYPQICAGYHVEFGQLFVKKQDGYLYGCGYNAHGKLGLGTTTNVSTLTKIPNVGTGFKKVWNLGRSTGCLIVQKSDSTIWGCGYNAYSQLGNSSTADVLSLIDLTAKWGSVVSTDEVDFQGAFSGDGLGQCTIVMSKSAQGGGFSIWTCGRNDWGQIGDGTTTNRTVPTNVLTDDTNDIKKMICFGGAPLTTYILTTSGSIYSWGYNGVGQLGTGNKTIKATIGSAYKINNSTAVDIWSTDDCHTNSHYASVFVKMSTGIIFAVGYNAHGQLGCGDLAEHTSFVQTLVGNHDIVDIQAISTTDSRAIVALTAKNQALIWGYNGSNDFGVGTAHPTHCTMPREINWI